MRITPLAGLALSALALLAACGGGGGDGTTEATVVGPISAFGSIVVNGLHLDDSGASISIDDETGTHEQLRLGMVVQVQARIRADGSGVASQVRYNDCIEGPIVAVNRVQNTLTVMGETVEVDDDTVFDGVTERDMNAFSIGDVVEVSCLPTADPTRMRASRMERKGTFTDGTTAVELTGMVSNLDLALGTCMVGTTAVDLSAIASADRPQGLANGMTVEATGHGYRNGILLADRLRDRDRDRLHVADASLLEVLGFVSDFVSIADFTVDGYRVDASAAVIRNGTAADIADGLKVEVDGRMDNGVLVASLLIIKRQTNVQVEARLQARGTAELTLLGEPIQVNDDTVLIDRSVSGTQPQAVTLDALAVGDRLEIMASRSATGNLVANTVTRTAPDPLVVVKGPADAKTPDTALTLGGFGVATGPGTRYRDSDGELIDAAAFYALVAVPPAVPSVVRARGVVADLAGNVVDATRANSTTGEVELGHE